MKRGIFIVLEGPDRSGKSTQASLLKAWIEAHFKREVLLTREPGGTSVAEKVREILLNPKSEIAPLTELFLYETSRAQHTMEKIVPALKSGKVIVSDRYTLSTVAYQGYGRRIDLETVEALNKIATNGLKPDLLFVFDIPDKIFAERERLAQKMFGPDRIEREPSAFRKRVNKAYKVLAKKPGAIRIDGGRSIDEIQGDIRARVARLLKK